MALPAGLDGGDSFATLYSAYSPRVAGLVRRLVAGSGTGAVDDIVQETFLRAYRVGIHLDHQSDPWPWLATVARNLCHDLHRRPDREVAFEESNVVALVPGPERAVEDRARAGYVAEALAEIPARQATLLLLHHVEERPCTEIARSEHTSVEAVKSALGRARVAFRSRYEGWRGWVPEVLSPVALRLRAMRSALARTATATSADSSPALRPGLAGALAAVLALGLVAPSGTASEPGTAAPSEAVVSGGPRSLVVRHVAGGAPEAPSLPAGGRLISSQPPESPDVPPTPALSSPRPASTVAPGAASPPSGPGSEGGPGLVPPLGGAVPDLDVPLVPDPDAGAALDGAAGTVDGALAAVAGTVAAPVTLPPPAVTAP